ncbi:hypothetical protein H920_18138 [Fukomys damarensis]|uniref:Uncharacterized protein n=1 Tax=Fukomys damarensis TaxID=885580 RepID=A0A091CSP5_FUKDA|nr:hypothetical protein H920_18138 [Fukomys damarensis]
MQRSGGAEPQRCKKYPTTHWPLGHANTRIHTAEVHGVTKAMVKATVLSSRRWSISEQQKEDLSGSFMKIEAHWKSKENLCNKGKHQITTVSKLEGSPPPTETWDICRGRAAGTCSRTLQSSTQEVRELNLGFAARNQPESQGTSAGVLRLIDLDLYVAPHIVYCDSEDIPEEGSLFLIN